MFSEADSLKQLRGEESASAGKNEQIPYVLWFVKLFSDLREQVLFIEVLLEKHQSVLSLCYQSFKGIHLGKTRTIKRSVE